MNKEQKVIISGMFISGLGLLCSSLFNDKSIIALNLLVFISSSAIVLSNFMKNKGITLKELDSYLDEKMNKNYEQKKYKEFALYAIIRPLIFVMISLIFLYILLFLIFL